MFAASLVVAFVLASVGPLLQPPSVLQIVSPVPFVLCAICMSVNSVPVRLVIEPVSFVLVTVHMPESALSICFIVLPCAFIPSAIWPGLSSLTMAHIYVVRARQPLPAVLGSVFERMFWPGLKFFFPIRSFFNQLSFLLVVLKIVSPLNACLLRQLFATPVSSVPRLQLDHSL